MQHYFGTIVGEQAILEGREIHHLINVRRAKVGENIEISDANDSFLCVIESIDPLSIKVLEKIVERRELDNDVSIAFGLLKGDHNDLIVLKGTELGVAKFYPFLSSRVIVQPKENEDNRIVRLRKIAREGAEQCRRPTVPEVYGYSKLEEILAMPADVKLFAYEGFAGTGDDLLTALEGLEKHKSVLIVIGPEGGFSHEEARLALDCDFRFVSLGRRILRAETAAIYAASIIGAASEKE